jgi:transcriptional regulator with XRE-family HTH domain
MIASERLKEARQKLNLTQKELGNIIGVKPAEISQYESGKRTPRWDAFNKILDVLNISADEVLGRETIVHDEEDYKIRLSKKDLQIVSAIKNNKKLYKVLSADPERNAHVINNNINEVFPEK